MIKYAIELLIEPSTRVLEFEVFIVCPKSLAARHLEQGRPRTARLMGEPKIYAQDLPAEHAVAERHHRRVGQQAEARGTTARLFCV